jgi:hypothetical protein
VPPIAGDVILSMRTGSTAVKGNIVMQAMTATTTVVTAAHASQRLDSLKVASDI